VDEARVIAETAKVKEEVEFFARGIIRILIQLRTAMQPKGIRIRPEVVVENGDKDHQVRPLVLAAVHQGHQVLLAKQTKLSLFAMYAIILSKAAKAFSLYQGWPLNSQPLKMAK